MATPPGLALLERISLMMMMSGLVWFDVVVGQKEEDSMGTQIEIFFILKEGRGEENGFLNVGTAALTCFNQITICW